jgi:hypothetical protein
MSRAWLSGTERAADWIARHRLLSGCLASLLLLAVVTAAIRRQVE